MPSVPALFKLFWVCIVIEDNIHTSWATVNMNDHDSFSNENYIRL
jgi:hypothetical protein